jgi:hypothetical protein
MKYIQVSKGRNKIKVFQLEMKVFSNAKLSIILLKSHIAENGNLL